MLAYITVLGCTFECNELSWVGVDLDGTLAKVEKENIEPPYPIGDPVESILTFCKDLASTGLKVKVFTAREVISGGKEKVELWLKKHSIESVFSGITATKDPDMIFFLDDRAFRVVDGKIASSGYGVPVVKHEKC